MYKLFNTEFKTKTEIKAYCKAVLDRTHENDHLMGETLGVMIELLGHRAGGKKLTKEIKSIFVRCSPDWGTKGFYILYKDGSILDFSYIKAVRDISLTKQYDSAIDVLANFKSAMRWEIKSQILNFKNLRFRENPHQVCAVSGELLEWNTTHVDHFPNGFHDLLWDFCQINRLQICDINLIDLGEIYEIEDRDLKKNWQIYHAQNASLRLTTGKANTSAKKPTTKDWHSVLGNVDSLKRSA